MNIIKNYLIIVNILLIFNLNVYAKTYESESLIDACYNEDMFCNVDTLNGNINIYLFIKKGCSHSKDMLHFLCTINDLYNNILNIKVYDISIKDNNYLFDMVSMKLKDNKVGYPYLVIGRKSYIGYKKNDEEKILKDINEYIKNNNIDVIKETINGNYKQYNKHNYIYLIVIFIAVLIGKKIIKVV